MVEQQDTGGEWLAAHTLSKAHRGKVLVQLINLGTSPVPLPNHTTIADFYVVPGHCISEAQAGVEAVYAPLQAAMTSLNDEQYIQLLEQQAFPFWHYPLPQQHLLLHQLLEKHLLVFATSPEAYGCTEAIDHPIHTGGCSAHPGVVSYSSCPMPRGQGLDP